MKAQKVQTSERSYGPWLFYLMQDECLSHWRAANRIYVTSSSSGGPERWAAETKQSDSFSVHKKMNFSAPSSSEAQMQQFLYPQKKTFFVINEWTEQGVIEDRHRRIARFGFRSVCIKKGVQDFVVIISVKRKKFCRCR